MKFPKVVKEIASTVSHPRRTGRTVAAAARSVARFQGGKTGFGPLQKFYKSRSKKR